MHSWAVLKHFVHAGWLYVKLGAIRFFKYVIMPTVLGVTFAVALASPILLYLTASELHEAHLIKQNIVTIQKKQLLTDCVILAIMKEQDGKYCLEEPNGQEEAE